MNLTNSNQPSEQAPGATPNGEGASPQAGSLAGFNSDSVQAQVNALQRATALSLVGLLIFIGVVNALLYWQVRIVRGELTVLRPVVNRMLTEYETVSGPRIQEFFEGLGAFSEEYPDFAPVLGKYIQATTNAPVPTPLQPLQTDTNTAAPDQ